MAAEGPAQCPPRPCACTSGAGLGWPGLAWAGLGWLGPRAGQVEGVGKPPRFAKPGQGNQPSKRTQPSVVHLGGPRALASRRAQAAAHPCGQKTRGGLPRDGLLNRAAPSWIRPVWQATAWQATARLLAVRVRGGLCAAACRRHRLKFGSTQLDLSLAGLS